MLCPPVTTGAVVAYARKGDVNWWMAAVMFVAYSFSNYYGAQTGRNMSVDRFVVLFGSLIFFVAILMVATADIEE